MKIERTAALAAIGTLVLLLLAFSVSAYAFLAIGGGGGGAAVATGAAAAAVDHEDEADATTYPHKGWDPEHGWLSVGTPRNVCWRQNFEGRWHGPALGFSVKVAPGEVSYLSIEDVSSVSSGCDHIDEVGAAVRPGLTNVLGVHYSTDLENARKHFIGAGFQDIRGLRYADLPQDDRQLDARGNRASCNALRVWVRGEDRAGRATSFYQGDTELFDSPVQCNAYRFSAGAYIGPPGDLGRDGP